MEWSNPSRPRFSERSFYPDPLHRQLGQLNSKATTVTVRDGRGRGGTLRGEESGHARKDPRALHEETSSVLACKRVSKCWSRLVVPIK